MSDTPVSSAPAPSSSPAPEAAPQTSSAPEPKQASEQQHSEAPLAGESKAEQARRLKLKVDGAEEDYDLSNEDQLRRDLQKARAADKRMAESAKQAKAIEDFYKALKNDPKSILRNPELGLNAREIAEQLLLEELEAEMMSPEEKRIREYEKRLKDYEAREQAEREAMENQQRQQQVMQAKQRWDNIIGNALEQSDLPKTAESVSRIAKAIRQAKMHGYEPDMSDIISEVRASYESEFSSLYSNASIDKLLKLNPKLVEQIRAHDMQSLKAKPTPQQPLPRDEKGRFQPSNGKEAPRTMNEMDFEAYLNNKLKGG